jgi:hypothetical protein
MTSELITTDLRWDQELVVLRSPEGGPELYAQAERGLGVIAAYTRGAPDRPSDRRTLRSIVDAVPDRWFLAVDPDPAFEGGGAVEITPGDPDPLLLSPSAPDRRVLRTASIRLVPPGAGRVRDTTLLHRGVGADGRVYIATSGDRAWWIVVPGTLGAAALAARIRATFGPVPHPGILVIDEADLPASVRRRIAAL